MGSFYAELIKCLESGYKVSFEVPSDFFIKNYILIRVTKDDHCIHHFMKYKDLYLNISAEEAVADDLWRLIESFEEVLEEERSKNG